MKHVFSFLLALATSVLFSALNAQSTFTEVSLISGVDHMYRSQMRMGGGVAFFDYDRDGDEDLALSGGLNPSRLYRNDGGGQFTDVSVVAGMSVLDNIQTMGVITGDIDNDGYRELFFTTFSDAPSILLYNNGDGTFSDITASSGIGADTSWGTSAAFGDVNLDGLLDIYVVNYLHDMQIIYDSLGDPIGFDPTCLPNHLYINQGNLSFLESAQAYGVNDSGCGLAMVFTAAQTSAHQSPDILIANDHGQWNIPNKLFHNQFPQAGFMDGSSNTGMDEQMYGMGIAVGDYDHDLDLDYYITNIGPNCLFEKQGAGFVNTAPQAGVAYGTLGGLNTTGWGTAFMDIDNDSWQDLFVANGHISVLPFIANNLLDPDKMYKNLGNGTFADITAASGLGDSAMSRGMAYSDYDLDGDLDLAVVSIHWDTASQTHTLLYRNELANGKHFAQIKLEGTVSNRDAYGARVFVYVYGTGATWLEEVNGGSSHLSQNSSILHLGMDTTSTFYYAQVFWPNGGIQEFHSLPVDSLVHLVEDSALFVTKTDIPLEDDLLKLQIAPNPSSEATSLHVFSPNPQSADLYISDLQGRRILHIPALELNAGTNQFLINNWINLQEGIYLIELITPQSKAFARIIRMK